MEELGVEVARCLVESAELPQYERAFRESRVLRQVPHACRAACSYINNTTPRPGGGYIQPDIQTGFSPATTTPITTTTTTNAVVTINKTLVATDATGQSKPRCN